MNRYISYLLIGSPGAGKGTQGNILGAIPRLRQAQLVEGLIEVRHAFHLFCRDREKVIQRLGNRALDDNRLDDANDTVIRRRLETYESETTPVLEFYRDKLTTIDATKAPVKVINEITSVILSLGRAGACDNVHECAVQKRSENLVPS